MGGLSYVSLPGLLEGFSARVREHVFIRLVLAKGKISDSTRNQLSPLSTPHCLPLR